VFGVSMWDGWLWCVLGREVGGGNGMELHLI